MKFNFLSISFLLIISLVSAPAFAQLAIEKSSKDTGISSERLARYDAYF